MRIEIEIADDICGSLLQIAKFRAHIIESGMDTPSATDIVCFAVAKDIERQITEREPACGSIEPSDLSSENLRPEHYLKKETK